MSQRKKARVFSPELRRHAEGPGSRIWQRNMNRKDREDKIFRILTGGALVPDESDSIGNKGNYREFHGKRWRIIQEMISSP